MLIATLIAIRSQALTLTYVFHNSRSTSALVFDQMLHTPAIGGARLATDAVYVVADARAGWSRGAS